MPAGGRCGFSLIDSFLPSFALFSLSLLLSAFGARLACSLYGTVENHNSAQKDWNVTGDDANPPRFGLWSSVYSKRRGTGPRHSRGPSLAASHSVVRRHTPPTTLDWNREPDGFNSMPLGQ
jgi:hypothetical protein